MRSAVLLGIAGMGLAATFLHCAANDASTSGPPASDSGAPDAPSSSSDGAVTIVPDADAAKDAGGDAGHCSADGWCRAPLPAPDLDLQTVWTFGPDDAIAAGSGGMIHWDGKSWSVVDARDDQDAGVGGFSGLWASDSDNLWAIAQGTRRLFHGKRGPSGFAWTKSEPDDGPMYFSIAGSTSGDLWIMGSHDDGSAALLHATLGAGEPALTEVPLDVSGLSTSGMWVASNGEPWLAGRTDSAVVVHGRRGAGDTWTWEQSLLVGPQYTAFPAITGIRTATTDVDRNTVWVLSSTSSNYHHGIAADGGWEAIANHTSVAMTALWASGKDDAWAVGYFGAVRHWDGKSWSVSQLAVHGNPIYEPISAIHGSSPVDIWAVGTNVLLHRGGAQ